MTHLETLLRQTDRSTLRSLCTQVEIDTFKITDRCPKACTHCSQSPDVGLSAVKPDQFARTVELVRAVEEATGEDMLARYLLTSTDSDPFFHPALAEIVRTLYEGTGRRFYLLTSGWYPHARRLQEQAEWIVEHHDAVEKIALTLSHFPTNPGSKYTNEEVFTNVIRTFRTLPPEKFLISPQYVDGAENGRIHSRERVEALLEAALKGAGLASADVVDRVHFRPVIGLGKALTQLGIQRTRMYRIEAEMPAPLISTREAERPYSGLVTMTGELIVLKAPRAILNRDLGEYRPITALAR